MKATDPYTMWELGGGRWGGRERERENVCLSEREGGERDRQTDIQRQTETERQSERDRIYTYPAAPVTVSSNAVLFTDLCRFCPQIPKPETGPLSCRLYSDKGRGRLDRTSPRNKGREAVWARETTTCPRKGREVRPTPTHSAARQPHLGHSFPALSANGRSLPAGREGAFFHPSAAGLQTECDWPVCHRRS